MGQISGKRHYHNYLHRPRRPPIFDHDPGIHQETCPLGRRIPGIQPRLALSKGRGSSRPRCNQPAPRLPWGRTGEHGSKPACLGTTNPDDDDWRLRGSRLVQGHGAILGGRHPSRRQEASEGGVATRWPLVDARRPFANGCFPRRKQKVDLQKWRWLDMLPDVIL
jgi:hypothetical protein